MGNLRQQNWIKLKFVTIVSACNSSTCISSCPRLLIGLYLCIIEVVRFSNKVGLKGKVFEVVSFSLSCFVFIVNKVGP